MEKIKASENKSPGTSPKLFAKIELRVFWVSTVLLLLVFSVWDFFLPNLLNDVFYWPFFDPFALKEIAGIYFAMAAVMISLFKELDNWDKIKHWVALVVLGQVMEMINIFVSYTSYNELQFGSLVPGIIICIFLGGLGAHIWLQKQEFAAEKSFG